VRHKLLIGSLVLGLLVLHARAAHGMVAPGDPAPNFSANELDAPPPAARTLASWPNKVLLFWLMGWG
jgi:hypothetical protein